MKVLVIEAEMASIFHIDVTLEWLQATVGGYIEVFSSGNSHSDWHGYCNEEGKIQALRPNTVATKFAHKLGWPRGDILVGNVIFLGNGLDGDEADVPEWLIEEFTKFAETVEEYKDALS